MAVLKYMIAFLEHLEALERGEMKFSCSYDEGDNYGDSCGSAEEQSEEGSDSEPEPDVVTEETQYEYVQIKPDDIELEDVEIEDEDIEVNEKHCLKSYNHLTVFLSFRCRMKFTKKRKLKMSKNC